MYTISQHPYRKKELLIKTNLPAFAIIAYMERIMSANEWRDNLRNNQRAKSILDLMIILERQYKKFILEDFDELYIMVNKCSRWN